jgi:hypothetical protein
MRQIFATTGAVDSFSATRGAVDKFLVFLVVLVLLAGAWAAGDKEPSLEVLRFEWSGEQARLTVKNTGSAPAAGARVRITSGSQLLGVLESRTTLTPGAEGHLEGALNAPAPGSGNVTLRATSNLATGKIYTFQSGDMSGQLSIEEMLRGRLGVEALEVPTKEVYAGEKVEVMVRVANLGEGAVGGTTVVLLEEGKEVARQRLLRRLGSGSKENVAFDWTPKQAGTLALSAALDPASAEPAPTVAVKVEPARQAELSVESVSFDAPPRENAACLVTVRVVNRGNAATFSIPVELKVGSTVVARKTERGRFEAGSIVDVPVRWVPKGGGSMSLVASLTGGQGTTVKVDVLGKPGVNLKVVRVEVPSKVLAGRPTQFVACVVNTGEIPAFSCTVTLKEGGMPVASARADESLEPGHEVKVPLSWTPGRPGPGTVVAEVESGGPGLESTTEDNRSEVQFEVLEPRK